jgi:hypothetical protein
MRKTPPSTAHSVDALADALAPIATFMLQGEMSAALLVQAAKLAYIRAAVSDLQLKGAKANVSRLSVVTGMTRKEVASLLKDDVSSSRGGRPKRLMEHRAIRVLRGWTTDPLYRNRMGRPVDLPLAGDGRNFASLVRAYGGDVTPVSVLRELERLSAVRRIRSGELRAQPRAARLNLNSSGRFKEFSRLLAGFSSTAGQVLVEKSPPLYLGFKEIQVSTEKEAESFKQSFGRRAALLLDGVENWSSRHAVRKLRGAARRRSSTQQVGLGVYLVHAEARAVRGIPRPIVK